jgi:hemerythrin superfamily protein
LERQHRELEAMFQRFQGLEDDYAAKESAFTRIADALAAHARIEEMIFYPAMFGVETGFELVDAVEDHVEVKRVLTDLLGMRVTDARFDAKMDALEQLVWRHVVEEEEDLFDMVEALDREARLELGTRMQRAYEQLLQTEPRFEVPDEIDYAAPVA